jgi:hypothetical protein
MTQTLESIVSIYDVKNLPTEKLCNLLKYSKHPKRITEALQKERTKRLEALIKRTEQELAKDSLFQK